MVDFERLDAAITHAVENPDEFDFGVFFARSSCGTTACLAGTIVADAGWTPVWGTGSTDDEAYDVEKDGEVRYVKDLASELLGLTEQQASLLFILAGGLEMAIRFRNEWAREAGVPERTWSQA